MPTSAHSSIYLHPLAYLLGLEGVALMRAFAGEFDREFTAARLAEVRVLLDAAGNLDATGDLDAPGELGAAVEIFPMSPVAYYDGWAASYDDPGNGLLPIEEPRVRAIVDRLPTGLAVDIAAGTGRHADYLARRGHRVYGFDASPRMLAVARDKVPTALFSQSDLRSLPLRSGGVDIVVCALALAHVEQLEPVFREVARVLRPGGHFVISDTRGLFIGSPRYPLIKRDLGGRLGYIPTWRHATSSYLRAALPHGFLVRDCQEPVRPFSTEPPGVAAPLSPRAPGEPPDAWELQTRVPVAATAAYETDPCLIVWDFELAGR